MTQTFTALVLNDLHGQTPTVRKTLRATAKKPSAPASITLAGADGFVYEGDLEKRLCSLRKKGGVSR